MNKIWLIFQREFLNRVQKKSFLIATILIPLIFPAIIAVMVWVAVALLTSLNERLRAEGHGVRPHLTFEAGDGRRFARGLKKIA